MSDEYHRSGAPNPLDLGTKPSIAEVGRGENEKLTGYSLSCVERCTLARMNFVRNAFTSWCQCCVLVPPVPRTPSPPLRSMHQVWRTVSLRTMLRDLGTASSGNSPSWIPNNDSNTEGYLAPVSTLPFRFLGFGPGASRNPAVQVKIHTNSQCLFELL